MLISIQWFRHVRNFAAVSLAITCDVFCPSSQAAVIAQDTLQTAVSPPPDLVDQADFLTPFIDDKISYDSNIYRLSPAITTLEGLDGIGPNARRGDRTETISVGVDGQWTAGRQTLIYDLSADKNFFEYNKNLNNSSTHDSVVLNWTATGALTGEAGASYGSNLASFVNATDYTKNIVDTTSFFGSARYQLGPRWALFGGLLESGTTLSAAATRENDIRTRAAEFGGDVALNSKDTLGLGYRLTEGLYPPDLALNANFQEHIAYSYFKRTISDKTAVEASAGYLRRTYENGSIRSFSGEIATLSFKWSVTEKTSIALDAWRRLQASITAQSDYYVSTGGSIGSTWAATEKISFSVGLLAEHHQYIPEVGIVDDLITSPIRADNFQLGRASFAYNPTKVLGVTVTYNYEKRSSNIMLDEYDDQLVSATLKAKF